MSRRHLMVLMVRRRRALSGAPTPASPGMSRRHLMVLMVRRRRALSGAPTPTPTPTARRPVRGPSGAMLPSTVLVRIATTANVDGDPISAFATVARRASVQGMDVQEAQRHGLDASTMPQKVYFGPPDPGVTRGDLIIVPRRLAEDPESPEPGECWVLPSPSPGVVKWFDGSAVVELCNVPRPGDEAAVDVAAGAVLLGRLVLTCAGPAEDTADRGRLFQVICTGRA